MHEAAETMYQDQVLELDEDKETLNFPDPYFLPTVAILGLMLCMALLEAKTLKSSPRF
jgi:hypothetical protein